MEWSELEATESSESESESSEELVEDKDIL